MKPIPEDTGSFLKIRTANPQMLYVDKTAYLHRLVTSGRSCVFLARPRRFGKSLMITTLKEIFNGRKDLFEGLAIAKTDFAWKKHPVLHFNFGFAAAATSYEQFESMLNDEIERALGEVGCEFDQKRAPGSNFARAIDALAAKAMRGEGELPVVLVDEYDDPVAKVLHDVPFAEKVRTLLATFYGQLKDRTEKYRFLMITGVSKFTKMSVFSTLSNLIDISFDDDYAMMLGYTEQELDEYFDDRMHAQAEKMGMAYDAYRAELRRLYNGYRFWKKRGENVYNPVSINLNLAKCDDEFGYYWSKTGRASMLMNILKRGDLLAVNPERVAAVSDDDFDVSDLANLRAVPMLYQTGYLTIKDYRDGLFTLCVPDDEVRRDLSKLMTGLIAEKDTAWAVRLGNQLRIGEWDSFFVGLKSLYAGAPYGSTEESVHEASFARNLQFLLAGQGFRMEPERTTSDGRIDLVADHPCGTYIFELKVDKPAEVAMDQTTAKAYAEPYLAPGKPVWLVGLSFARDTRRFVEGTVQQVKSCNGVA